jgi:NAD(P)H-dependent flavin oxidoreductase YrpB (nitropropane dioxygenase family)
VSFAGAPTKDAVARCHDAGVVVMPTVGARRHAEKVLEMGVDAVIAQGGEGGGHTGSVPWASTPRLLTSCRRASAT